MWQESPLLMRHRLAGALLLPWGREGHGAEVVGAFGPPEAEYAALRTAGVLLDEPQRATLGVRGTDRLDFLHRMVTQDLRGMAPGSVRRAFWLNRTGRIDADLRVLCRPDEVLLDVDAASAPGCAAGLESYIISEDVSIADVSPQWHRLAVHGPRGPEVVAHLAGADGARVRQLAPGQGLDLHLAGVAACVDRDDTAGVAGLHVLVARDGAAQVYGALLDAGAGLGSPSAAGHPRPALRPGGWHAFNVARIEAGTPLFHVDFGPDSLPHETGVLASRVSFTKGCYLGQEIVARMHALGKAKRELVPLRLERRVPASPDDAAGALDPLQPDTGADVLDAGGAVVGAVTSSAISPMLGGTPVAFAMVRRGSTAPGTALRVRVGDAALAGVVQPGLRFWPAPPTA